LARFHDEKNVMFFRHTSFWYVVAYW
jgi:hypothetical protein